MSSFEIVTSDRLRKGAEDLPNLGGEEEIPSEVLFRAEEEMQKFFQRELDIVSNENMQWVMERIAPAMARQEMKTMGVDINQVEKFFEELGNEVKEKIAALEEINFSRGHEREERTFPTTEEIAPMTSWLKNLAGLYDQYKKVPNFKKDFQLLFSPYIEALLLRVKNQALLSRNAQLQMLLLNKDKMDKMDFEGQKSLVETHIEALQTKHQQPLLEFRDLLNLSQLPWLKRKPTMDEQKAFQFLAWFV
ncbi:hypothetical protein [Simkania negevensis]|uniref:Uncharacterized protein n=1 Tax=Simkania negevensis (strain ATCC VR-1471 / DSM 27360 / Z) TaxID=331113 RepID=F8L541_SIMNZ|nr:hypothetical protein [Simkania negevensis]CCB87922.1 unknown protein [Simkania negevensis Z]